MEYEELLKITPDHLTEEFLEYLRTSLPENVVKELDNWLIVENIKYHHKEGFLDHWTAFYKNPETDCDTITAEAWKEFYAWIPSHRQVLINRKSDRSIKRFHVHIIK